MINIIDTWQTIGRKSYFTGKIKLDMGAVEGSALDCVTSRHLLNFSFSEGFTYFSLVNRDKPCSY
jgi:hypothetical protein